MVDLGLRVGEVVALRPEHMDLDANPPVVRVREGKGAKDRDLPIMDATLLRDLQTWDERRADDFPESPWLLPTRTGGQVTRQHLYRVVKRMADRAGLPEPLPSPHDLRHTLGTWLYRETHDLVKVAKTLGHSDTTTAEIYTHLNGADVEDGLSALADSRADEDGSADGPADDGHGAENVTRPTSVPAVLPPPAGVRSSTSEWQRARGPGSAARTDQPATPSAAGPSRRPPGATRDHKSLGWSNCSKPGRVFISGYP